MESGYFLANAVERAEEADRRREAVLDSFLPTNEEEDDDARDDASDAIAARVCAFVRAEAVVLVLNGTMVTGTETLELAPRSTVPSFDCRESVAIWCVIETD